MKFAKLLGLCLTMSALSGCGSAAYCLKFQPISGNQTDSNWDEVWEHNQVWAELCE